MRRGRGLVGGHDEAGVVFLVTIPERAEQRRQRVGGLNLAPPGQDALHARHRPSSAYALGPAHPGRSLHLTRISTVKPFAARRASATVEKAQLENATQPDWNGTQRLDEAHRRGRRASGGQHVVDDEHPLAFRERVGVDLQAVLSVFERVLLGLNLPGQFAGLADRTNPRRA